MNSKEFLEEVRESNHYSLDFEKEYKKFLWYQRKIATTLRVFHRICEEHQIRYQLAYGSLLGAIRDNGQIPWDYDVDVWVPYTEKEKLLSCLALHLPSDYYFYCPETNKECRHYMTRITPKGYDSSVLHVDVFYMVGTSNTDAVSKEQIRTIKRCINVRYEKLVDIRKESRNSLKKTTSLVLKRIKNLPISLQRTNALFYKTCAEFPFDLSNKAISTDEDTGAYIFNTSKTWDTFLIETSIGNLRVSKNYDSILTGLYGDYKKVPNLESRINDIHQAVKTFEWFDGLAQK